jgi:hypothetical protein
MIHIGNLYKVKKWSWLLFPTKETAIPCHTFADDGAATAAWYSKRFNFEVTYFSLDSYIVFLEEDGVFKKVLTSDGRIGWIWWSDESYNDCFEEMKTE